MQFTACYCEARVLNRRDNYDRFFDMPCEALRSIYLALVYRLPFCDRNEPNLFTGAAASAGWKEGTLFLETNDKVEDITDTAQLLTMKVGNATAGGRSPAGMPARPPRPRAFPSCSTATAGNKLLAMVAGNLELILGLLFIFIGLGIITVFGLVPPEPVTAASVLPSSGLGLIWKA